MYGVAHRTALFYSERRRFLKVDVFTGEGGFHCWLGMPMVRGTDNDRIYVSIGQHVMIVAVGLYIHVIRLVGLFGVLLLNPSFTEIHSFAVHVAYCNDPRDIISHDIRQVMAFGNSTKTDLSNVDLITRRIFTKNRRRHYGREAGNRQGSSNCTLGSRLHKIPSGDGGFILFHSRISL